jgi:hypothetical protein
MDYISIPLLIFILGCLIHLERVVAKMGEKVTMMWNQSCNNKDNPRPKKARGRGLDKNKKGE